MFPVVFLAAVAFWGTVLGGGFYFVRRYVRAIERRNGGEALLTDLRARIDALEEEGDSLRRDVERLDTAQDFTTRLLGSRAGPVEPRT